MMAPRHKMSHRYKKLKSLFLLGCLSLTGLVLWGVTYGIKQERLIFPSEIAAASGASYSTGLPESPYWLFENLTDSTRRPNRSKTELFENDTPLGPPHSLHDLIRDTGSGQFSHWGSDLYFSSSDNTDPRTNRRHYKVVVTATIPVWTLAVLMPCLLISLYLNRSL